MDFIESQRYAYGDLSAEYAQLGDLHQRRWVVWHRRERCTLVGTRARWGTSS
jgi:hypothetical protein